MKESEMTKYLHNNIFRGSSMLVLFIYRDCEINNCLL